MMEQSLWEQMYVFVHLHVSYVSLNLMTIFVKKTKQTKQKKKNKTAHK